jgi:hypothetical protein
MKYCFMWCLGWTLMGLAANNLDGALGCLGWGIVSATGVRVAYKHT